MRLKLTYTGGTNATVVRARNAQLEVGSTASTFRVGVESPSNDPTVAPGRSIFFWCEGDAPAPVRGYHAGSTNSYMIAAADAAGAVATFANYGYKQAESMTLGTDTTAIAVGATASGTGNDVANTSFATNNTLTPPRLTWTLSATELAGCAGRRIVIWARVRSGNADDMTLQARVGFSTDITGTLLPAVHLRPSQIAFYDVALGIIDVPATPSAMQIVCYAMRDTGAGLLDWDFLQLAPATQAGYHAATSGRNTVWTLLETDPSVPKVGAVDTGHLQKSVGISHGPVPFVAQPGLNVVYGVLSTFDDDDGTFPNDTFAARARSFYYSPRYFV